MSIEDKSIGLCNLLSALSKRKLLVRLICHQSTYLYSQAFFGPRVQKHRLVPELWDRDFWAATDPGWTLGSPVPEWSVCSSSLLFWLLCIILSSLFPAGRRSGPESLLLSAKSPLVVLGRKPWLSASIFWVRCCNLSSWACADCWTRRLSSWHNLSFAASSPFSTSSAVSATSN